LKPNSDWHVLTVSMLLVLNNFIKNLLIVKSKDEDNGNDSKPYSNNGMHLLESNCSVTSSEAIVPTLPKIAFAAL